MKTTEEAKEITNFFLQPNLFFSPLTPGEKQTIKTHPLQALAKTSDAYWYTRDSHNQICAAIGIKMHINNTGIFEVPAVAVHSNCRKNGMGQQLFETAFDHIRTRNGRGMIVDTSGNESYKPMHNLLVELGFKQVGCFPDFYYPGEDAVWYFKALLP